jgi:hypothetical protein
MAAAVVDSQVSKPQQSVTNTKGLVSALLNLGERQEEGQGQHKPISRVELVIRTRDMETQTDQGSEIQGGMGTTQIPIDYMDTRMEQLYPSPELGDEEERLAASEVEKEEGDYVQQPQPEPDPKPLMEDEPVEVMAREFLPLEPTPEQRYEAYLRNRNANIIQKVAGMLELDNPKDIPRAIAQLQYFKSYKPTMVFW